MYSQRTGVGRAKVSVGRRVSGQQAVVRATAQ